MLRIGGLNLIFWCRVGCGTVFMRVDEAPGLRGCELAPRRGLHPAAFLRHRRIKPLFASRMKQKKDHEGRQRGQVRVSSHPWVGRGAPSGLIKPFELDRRRESEESSIESAGPSRSHWSQQKLQLTGTAVRRRVRERSRASPSLFAGVRQLPWPHTRSLRKGDVCLTSTRTIAEARVLSSMRDSGSCRL